MTPPESSPWLLLIHQIPPKPDYLRVRIGRRLQQVGAVAVKNTVYALPNRRSCREDLEWIVREIKSEGGEALLSEAALVEGLDDVGLRELFHDARNADFEALAREAEEIASGASPGGRKAAKALLRLERKLAGISRLDFFDAPTHAKAEQALHGLRDALRTGTKRGHRESDDTEFRGRVWVTRPGIEEDRIASAWLIRRFIDPRAEFQFLGESAGHREGQLRFDMFDGEFTHDGDRCTFEVLAERFVPEDETMSVLAEIIHEIDLGDEKFLRPETPGIERLIQGIVAVEGTDGGRLHRGALVLDALYAAFGGRGGLGDDKWKR